MDIVFTKTSDNMVMLEFWRASPYNSAPPMLYNTVVVPHDQASRMVGQQRPDILNDFNAWVAMNF